MGHDDEEATPGEGGGGWERRVETCRIVPWRGYRTAAFYAHRAGDPSGTSVTEESSPFRWRGAETPDTAEARAAHLQLVARLKEDGWTEIGQGGNWYETELARAVMVRSEDEDPPEVGQADPLPEPDRPEHEPESEPAPPPPPPARREAAGVAAATAGGPSSRREYTPPRPRRRVNRWRVAAAAGLVGAIGLLSWAATHPSVLSAAPYPPGATSVR